MPAERPRRGPDRDSPGYGLWSEKHKSPGTLTLSEIARGSGIKAQVLKKLLVRTRIAVPREMRGYGGVPAGHLPFFPRRFYQLTEAQAMDLLLAYAAMKDEQFLRRRRLLPKEGAGVSSRFTKESGSRNSILAKYLRRRRRGKPSARSRIRYSASSPGASTGS